VKFVSYECVILLGLHHALFQTGAQHMIDISIGDLVQERCLELELLSIPNLFPVVPWRYHMRA
jgi:hypothetical protein